MLVLSMGLRRHDHARDYLFLDGVFAVCLGVVDMNIVFLQVAFYCVKVLDPDPTLVIDIAGLQLLLDLISFMENATIYDLSCVSAHSNVICPVCRRIQIYDLFCVSAHADI